MNINELTIGQAKDLAEMFSGQLKQEETAHRFVGLYVIARCYAAGVHAGFVVSVNGENVILKDSVRLWSWKAREGIALSGVAQHGIKSESKLDAVNPLVYLTGVCEIIPCSEKAKESING